MANAVRVRVEAKKKHRNIKDLITEFKRAVDSAGILHEYKEHQYYESRSEKLRRKKREAHAKRRRAILEEKFFAGERVKLPSGLAKKIKGNFKD